MAEDKQTPRILPATMGNELPTTTTDTASEKLSGGVGGRLAPIQELIERLILTLSERDSVPALGHSGDASGEVVIYSFGSAGYDGTFPIQMY